MAKDRASRDASAMELGEVREARYGKAAADDSTGYLFETSHFRSAEPTSAVVSEDPDNDEIEDPANDEPNRKTDWLSSGDPDDRLLSAISRVFKRGNGDVILSFDELAKLNILHLSFQLLEIHKDTFRSKDIKSLKGRERVKTMGQIENALHRYTTATRDFDFMVHLERSGIDGVGVLNDIAKTFHGYPKCEFSDIKEVNIKSRRVVDKTDVIDPLRNYLRRNLPRSLACSLAEKKNRPDYASTQLPMQVSPFVDRLARFIVAITGGLALVVPMLIMRLNQNSTKILAMTSIAVLIFSAVVSVLFKASNAETLGITAAYAAVLVVFVGTSA